MMYYSTTDLFWFRFTFIWFVRCSFTLLISFRCCCSHSLFASAHTFTHVHLRLRLFPTFVPRSWRWSFVWYDLRYVRWFVLPVALRSSFVHFGPRLQFTIRVDPRVSPPRWSRSLLLLLLSLFPFPILIICCSFTICWRPHWFVVDFVCLIYVRWRNLPFVVHSLRRWFDRSRLRLFVDLELRLIPFCVYVYVYVPHVCSSYVHSLLIVVIHLFSRCCWSCCWSSHSNLLNLSVVRSFRYCVVVGILVVGIRSPSDRFWFHVCSFVSRVYVTFVRSFHRSLRFTLFTVRFLVHTLVVGRPRCVTIVRWRWFRCSFLICSPFVVPTFVGPHLISFAIWSYFTFCSFVDLLISLVGRVVHSWFITLEFTLVPSTLCRSLRYNSLFSVLHSFHRLFHTLTTLLFRYDLLWFVYVVHVRCWFVVPTFVHFRCCCCWVFIPHVVRC